MRYSARMINTEARRHGGIQNEELRIKNGSARRCRQRSGHSEFLILNSEFLGTLVLASALLLIVAIPGSAGKKPKGAPLARLPNRSAEIADLALPNPAQKCQNWAWAAVVEAILQAQQVPLKQNFWVQKVNGSEICVEALPTPQALGRAIDGRYVLDDGRKMRLQSRYFGGAPTTPDDVIAPLRQGTPLLLFWNERAFLLRAVVYDEYIYPNGQRMFQIMEMKLLDPLAPPRQREVSFVNGRDDPAEILGILQVTVIPEDPMPWQR